MHCRCLRAQGATEYLVILAVVLMIGLLAISLLGFFPGTSGDISESESELYWKTLASPFRITERQSFGPATECVLPNTWTAGYKFVLINSGYDKISLIGVNINGVAKDFCKPGDMTSQTSIDFSPGKQRAVAVVTDSIPTFPPPATPLTVCTPGQTVELDISFNYSTSYVDDKLQTGSKKLVFKCS